MITLTTYMEMVRSLHKLNHALHGVLDYNTGKSWAKLVSCSTLAVKGADLVIIDRLNAEMTA